ncbi:hypothetical protein [Desulfovibrio sp. UIB00]|uniref:hypothetical protein n=1 Tax=Desulfovibrio sp. UIB00 TaxID=2804314 RepID=UPI001F0E7631|nr:hypothetical protein [Desulfovibrio sp. UIB00]
MKENTDASRYSCGCFEFVKNEIVSSVCKKRLFCSYYLKFFKRLGCGGVISQVKYKKTFLSLKRKLRLWWAKPRLGWKL